MGTDELLVNVILRRELGWAREVPKRTWLFLLHRLCVMTPHDMKGYTEDMLRIPVPDCGAAAGGPANASAHGTDGTQRTD